MYIPKLKKRNRKDYLSYIFDLSTLSTDSPGELDILGHDGDPLGMDGTEVSVFKQTHQVRLRSLLKCKHGVTLEPQISLIS